jgi:hypothetical protein
MMMRSELTRLLEASGFNDPSAQIYIVTEV